MYSLLDIPHILGSYMVAIKMCLLQIGYLLHPHRRGVGGWRLIVLACTHPQTTAFMNAEVIGTRGFGHTIPDQERESAQLVGLALHLDVIGQALRNIRMRLIAFVQRYRQSKSCIPSFWRYH